jgi:hypothetical protein
VSLNLRAGQPTPVSLRWRETSTAWGAQVGPMVRAALRDKAPVGQGAAAGRLRDSIWYRQTIDAGSTRLSFTSTVPYARYVVEGTGPHIIRPRKSGGVLAWSQGGQRRFARYVNHPGTKPNPFPERAIRPLMPQIRERFQQVVAAQLRSAP